MAWQCFEEWVDQKQIFKFVQPFMIMVDNQGLYYNYNESEQTCRILYGGSCDFEMEINLDGDAPSTKGMHRVGKHAQCIEEDLSLLHPSSTYLSIRYRWEFPYELLSSAVAIFCYLGTWVLVNL